MVWTMQTGGVRITSGPRSSGFHQLLDMNRVVSIVNGPKVTKSHVKSLTIPDRVLVFTSELSLVLL